MASLPVDSTEEYLLPVRHTPFTHGDPAYLRDVDAPAHTPHPSSLYRYPSPTSTPVLQYRDSSLNSISSGTAVSNHGRAMPQSGIVKIEHMTPSEVMSPLYYHAEFHPFRPEGSLVEDVRALKCTYERGGLQACWSHFVSPEGTLYFINKENSTVTLTNITHDHEARYIDAAIAQLRQEIDEAKFPEHTDLVVALASNDDSESSENEPIVGYYLADWTHQVVTWLEDWKTSRISGDERAIISEPHLELKLRAQFWAHARIFPNHRALPANAIQEFKDILVCKLCGEVNSQPQTSAPSATGQEVASFSRVSSMLLEITCKDIEMTPAMTFIASQSLQQTYDERFLSAWGEPGSRLDRSGGAAKKDHEQQTSFVFFILSAFFLFLPHVYLHKLRAPFYNGNVHFLLWKRSFEEIKQHWGSLLLPSTVLFTGTLGFITISDSSQMRTPAQIIAMIVIILDFFVIVTTHFLKNAKDTNDMLKYIDDRRRGCTGLGGVAILFSVPLVCFMWSVCILIADAAWVFFSNSTLAMKIALGVLVALLIILVLLLIPFTMKPTMEQEQVSNLMDKLVEYIDRTFRPNSNN